MLDTQLTISMKNTSFGVKNTGYLKLFKHIYNPVPILIMSHSNQYTGIARVVSVF